MNRRWLLTAACAALVCGAGVGADVKSRYAELKKASADRCPRLLGTFVKAPEVQYHHDVYNQYLWNLF